jgi:hypothetical protein
VLVLFVLVLAEGACRGQRRGAHYDMGSASIHSSPRPTIQVAVEPEADDDVVLSTVASLDSEKTTTRYGSSTIVSRRLERLR